MPKILSRKELKKLGLSKQEINTYNYLINSENYNMPNMETEDGLEEFRRTLIELSSDGEVNVYEQESWF